MQIHYLCHLSLKIMLKSYGIPNCNSMKNAFDLLKSKNISFEFHDYKKKGLSPEKLNDFLKNLGSEIVLNRQGSTYKQVDEQTKASIANIESLKTFLLQKTSAIKRPIFEYNGNYLAGLNEKELDSFLTI